MTTGPAVELLALSFGHAVAAKDHDRIRELLSSDLDFRGMTPGRVWEADGPHDVVVALERWFSADDEIEQLERIETDAFADCGHVSYRLRVRNADGLHLVEQQAYVVVA